MLSSLLSRFGRSVPSSSRTPRTCSRLHSMAGTKFAYVKNFELPDTLLPGTYILLRLDGHGFHR